MYKMTIFLFLFFWEWGRGVGGFRVFFYAYGGLHRWSPRREKTAKVGFGSQRKQKKKVTEKKVKYNLTNYFKKKFKYLFIILLN